MLLFPKQLMLDTDPMELARVKSVLSQNGIPYEVKTTVADNALSRSFNVAAGMKWRTGYADMAQQSYVYKLSVARRDYGRARALAYGKDK